ncbi:transcription initiation factor TFIID subunit 4-like [Eptesicus fuscus]|uniref:transcription initiation factor TFIID subunit 4-like n=1 Tax=Eptesicus fuscus TaxID=29078 RepID=UPI0024044FA8|nr:transcription initiation factor TFIID subunit 4-like [Eptesicus fuscus]
MTQGQSLLISINRKCCVNSAAKISPIVNFQEEKLQKAAARKPPAAKPQLSPRGSAGPELVPGPSRAVSSAAALPCSRARGRVLPAPRNPCGQTESGPLGRRQQVSAGLSEAARAAAGRCEHRRAASPATRRRASSGCNLAGASRSARRPCSGAAPRPGGLRAWRPGPNFQGGAVECKECFWKTPASATPPAARVLAAQAGAGPERAGNSGARPAGPSPLRAGDRAEVNTEVSCAGAGRALGGCTGRTQRPRARAGRRRRSAEMPARALRSARPCRWRSAAAQGATYPACAVFPPDCPALTQGGT